MSVIDIVFLAIIGIFAFFSYRRGLLATVLEVIAFVLAVVVAFFASKPVGTIFYQSFIRSSIENHIENSINEINFDNKTITKDQGAEIIFENIPDFAKKIAVGTGLSENNIMAKAKNSNFTAMSLTDKVLTNVVDPIVLPATIAISFIILAAVFIFLFRLFARMLSSENEDDGFTVNKLLGGFLGIAKGAVVVYVVCALLKIIYYSSADPTSGFSQMLDKSAVFNWMVTNNPVIESLKTMF